MSTTAMGILYLGFALLVLMLYAFDRTEAMLLWPLAACLLGALVNGVNVLFGTTQALTALQGIVLQLVGGSICGGLWLMTWWTYFGLRDRKWIRNAIGVLVLWSIANSVLFQILLFRGSASHTVFAAQTMSWNVRNAAVVVLLILIAYFGWRRPQRESWILFLALFFYAIGFLPPVLFQRLHIPVAWFPFGIAFNLYIAFELAVLFCFSFVLLRHFRSSQRRQQAMEEDVAQAQQVQQVLIPEELPPVPGLTIESEYRPAREVGGDFFQIVPHSADGSVLIVVGDVTGHGLQAGMLVALIVGAIRNQVESSFEPLRMLETLNRRLCGRGHAHATCLALRIAADGAATLANAGHLPPYLNGKELPMEGAMLLGMIENAEFSVMDFQLHEEDRLILMSDGIAEAQDAQGRLFGFERIRAMLEKPVSAAEVATVAQNFGQEDDISVLLVTRSWKEETAVAAEFAGRAGS